MSYFQPILLKKLEEFLRGDVKKDDVYRWALSQVVLPRYEEEVKEGTLLSETMQALVDIVNENPEIAPSIEDLKYYRQCLRGAVKFVPKSQRRQKTQKKAQGGIIFKDVWLAMRIYIILFAGCSVLVNIFSIINPNFLRMEFFPPTRLEAFLEAFPHFIYTTFLLISPKTLVQRKLFIPSAIILLLGCIYYWFVTISFVTKLLLHVLMIIVVAPFSGIPATLALLLLLHAKNKHKERIKDLKTS